MKKKTPPVYLQLSYFKWPWTAILSIMHRLSGVFLYILFAPLVFLLDTSTKNPSGFQFVESIATAPWATLLLFFLLWALLHHLASGIRFLLIDFDIGVSKNAAQASARWITLSAGLLALIWTTMLIL